MANASVIVFFFLLENVNLIFTLKLMDDLDLGTKEKVLKRNTHVKYKSSIIYHYWQYSCLFFFPVKNVTLNLILTLTPKKRFSGNTSNFS